MTYQEEQENIRRIAFLCLEKRPLTDEELTEINQNGRDVSRFFSGLEAFASYGVKNEMHYRSRKKELDTLPTDELDRQYDALTSSRADRIAADTYDDEDDSLYEAPAFYSDECILRELLEDRKKAQSTAA
jgi:hypothetical protein